MVPEEVDVSSVPNSPTKSGDTLVEVADDDSPFVEEVSFNTNPDETSSGKTPVVLTPTDQPVS